MAGSLLITNGTVITWEHESELIEKGAVYVEDGRIVEVGAASEIESRYQADERIDARGQLIMPGNICAHTHFYGAFARGMAIPGPAPKDFPEILERLWWPLDQALHEEDVRYSTLVCLVDAIKHGTTTLIDHHASPNALAGSLDVIANAVDEAGLRAVLCYEVTDRYGPESARASIEENVRFLKAAKERPNIAATFGLHASLTVSDETLAACVEAAEGLETGFHIHVAEHEADEYDSLNKSGMRVVDRLEKAGILGERTIVAHCVHTDVREIEILRDTRTWVTHQPRSNMNNAVGAADIEGMLRMGIPVCLGNDGFSNNMWAEWKTAYLLHKVWHRDPRRANGMDIVRMAIHNNAALASTFFPETPPGLLISGSAADIILVDYHPTTPLTAGNLPWHIIFGFEASMVTTTIAAGRVLMKDRELLTLDEAEITARSRELASATWERYNAIAGKLV
ncbi:MAG TPA: putative aminohydrolase SsnA [Chloroflexi bacterium]|nr:putative aminohydrolase SsnA [Chloroflexota bacterium]